MWYCFALKPSVATSPLVWHCCQELVSHARELSVPLSSKTCLQPGAGGAGLVGSSVPFTLSLFLLQMLKSWYVSLLGHWLLTTAWKTSCKWQIQCSVPGAAVAGCWLTQDMHRIQTSLEAAPIPAICTMATCCICSPRCGEWTSLMQQQGSGKGCITAWSARGRNWNLLKKSMGRGSCLMWASPCRDHRNMDSSIELQDAWPVSPQCRTPTPRWRPMAKCHWCQAQGQRTRTIPVKCPTGSKAKGTGKVDLAMQRDKLVLSHLLKTIVQEENPTLNVAPNKKRKSSSRKLFWGKVILPGALGRRKEGMRGAYMGLQRNSVSPGWGRGTTQASLQVAQGPAPAAFASVEWHLRLAKNVHHVSLFGASLITSIYKQAKENNHHSPLPLPAKPSSAAL